MEHNNSYKDTIDLGKLVEILFRQWQLIIIVTLLSAFASGLVSALLPKPYETQALVSTTRQISNVTFGSQIQTLTEEELQYARGNYESRMKSYVAMVKNPIIAQGVLGELGDKIPEDLQEVGKLLKMAEGELLSQSDSIAVKIQCSDPVLAAEIANAWARLYVEHLNSIYADSGDTEVATAVQRQSEEYNTRYEYAQSEIEGFLANNKSDELQRQITELETILTNLQNSQIDAVNITISKMVEHDMSVVDNYFAAAAQQQNYILSEYNQRYAELSRLTSLLAAAENMRSQIQHGGSSAAQSNALALMILKMEAFSVYEPQIQEEVVRDSNLTSEQVYVNQQSYSGSELPSVQLQTNLETVTSDQMLSDLDSLISVLETYQGTLEEELKALSQDLAYADTEKTDLELLAQKMRSEGALGTSEEFLTFTGVEDILLFGRTDTPLQKKIADVEQQIRDLQADLEESQAHKRELIQKRDLYWNTYKVLKTKAAELDVSANTSNRAVSLAVTAPVPSTDTINMTMNISVTAFVGFVLIIGSIFIIEFWWSYKGIEPKPITLKMILSSQEE